MEHKLSFQGGHEFFKNFSFYFTLIKLSDVWFVQNDLYKIVFCRNLLFFLKKWIQRFLKNLWAVEGSFSTFSRWICAGSNDINERGFHWEVIYICLVWINWHKDASKECLKKCSVKKFLQKTLWSVTTIGLFLQWCYRPRLVTLLKRELHCQHFPVIFTKFSWKVI